jgi:transglutaminase-like putative cysteine protease
VIRRLVPLAPLPLSVLATVLAATPWQRSFPASILPVPLYGAAVLSVCAAYLLVRLTGGRLVVSVLVEVLLWVGYELLVVLHAPLAGAQLWRGVVHGPAEILTFALPLVTPRSLLVAPVALTWLAGTVAGECRARRWTSLLPYVGWALSFALAWAATQRAGQTPAQERWYGIVLPALLLMTMLVLRACETWTARESGAVASTPGNLLPLRSVGLGVLVSVLVALVSGAAAHAAVFGGHAKAPGRAPSVNRSGLLTPVAYIAGLRPSDPTAVGSPVFTITLDNVAPGFVDIANVDTYDGQGWSFERTFRPAGGVVPADPDPALHPATPAITQHVLIADGPLAGSAWLPVMYRATRLSGIDVDVDPSTGMVVPAQPLRTGESYSATSAAPLADFAELAAPAAATSPPPADLEIPPAVATQLATFVRGLAGEVGRSPTAPMAYLQALLADLHSSKYALVGGSRPASAQRSASLGFADVLTSIGGRARAGTPEQFATLFALIARQLGVPARVATGFRISTGPTGSTVAAAGTYRVTTAQAWTWVQLAVRDVGWVTVDPSPSGYTDQQRQPPVTGHPQAAPSPVPTQAAEVNNSGGHAVAKPSTVASRPARSVWVAAALTLAVAVAAVGVLLAALLGVGLLRRSRRRRADDPRLRLLGAWRESLDLLDNAGIAGLSRATTAEAVTATRAGFGPAAATQVSLLGTAANEAMYRPTAQVGADTADAGWQAYRALNRAVRESLPLRRRLSLSLRYRNRSTRR